MSKLIHTLLSGTSLFLLSLPGYAIAGVELIDQAKVIASGGFPYTITKPGSYRLSSNLHVTGGHDGIHIQANNVSLDLDGFAITQTGQDYSVGTGISDNGSSISGVSVRNGSMTGWSSNIDLADCSLCRAQQIVIAGGAFGIVLGSNGMASENLVSGPGNSAAGTIDGISTGPGSSVIGNVATQFTNGIEAGVGSTISGNTAYQNFAVGILASCPSNLVGNTADLIGKIGSGCTLFNNNAR